MLMIDNCHGMHLSCSFFISFSFPTLTYTWCTLRQPLNPWIMSISYSYIISHFHLVLFNILSPYILTMIPPVPQLWYSLLLVNRWISPLYFIYMPNILSSAGEQHAVSLSRLVSWASWSSLLCPLIIIIIVAVQQGEVGSSYLRLLHIYQSIHIWHHYCKMPLHAQAHHNIAQIIGLVLSIVILSGARQG